MKNRGSWKVVPKELYDPMVQAMVILNNRKIYENEAIQFKDFILSSQGKKILHKFGYNLIE